MSYNSTYDPSQESGAVWDSATNSLKWGTKTWDGVNGGWIENPAMANGAVWNNEAGTLTRGEQTWNPAMGAWQDPYGQHYNSAGMMPSTAPADPNSSFYNPAGGYAGMDQYAGQIAAQKARVEAGRAARAAQEAQRNARNRSRFQTIYGNIPKGNTFGPFRPNARYFNSAYGPASGRWSQQHGYQSYESLGYGPDGRPRNQSSPTGIASLNGGQPAAAPPPPASQSPAPGFNPGSLDSIFANIYGQQGYRGPTPSMGGKGGSSTPLPQNPTTQSGTSQLGSKGGSSQMGGKGGQSTPPPAAPVEPQPFSRGGYG